MKDSLHRKSVRLILQELIIDFQLTETGHFLYYKPSTVKTVFKIRLFLYVMGSLHFKGYMEPKFVYIQTDE